jgi:hypothetical protein
MGLIAKGYETRNPNPKTYSSHQLDLIGTILWLTEVVK